MNTKIAPILVFGIANCDTVKKARTWFNDHALGVQFHDFKKSEVSLTDLSHWAQAVGWETLLNRKGTTWRKLDIHVQASVTDAKSACETMLAHPSCIKRPVVVWPQGQITVGFSPERFAALLT
jgi:Spx/MgsR family transcriptional regulator